MIVSRRISCGPSGLVILDLDVPGRGQHAPAGATAASDGAGALAGLCREQGQPFPFGTFTAGTPSGGRHLYFS
jgi:Bifunctional DNA primase/polymerase, N-terminal